MDLKSFLLRAPMVYTTNLDDMLILRKDLSKMSSKYIIESIISESKPRYKESDKQNNEPFIKHLNKQSKPNFKSRFEKLKSKLEVLKNKSKQTDKQTEVVIKSEIETDINTQGIKKLESLLAMCKPLKIVLEDINKNVKKQDDEIKMEVLSISSDSDDDIITLGQYKIKDRSDAIKESATPTGKSIMSPPVTHTIKHVNDLKNILTNDDLRDCVIVIYNLYLKELDAYQIGKFYNVTEYQTRKYTEVYKFPMKKCKLIINIIACCWKNRQCYVSLLLKYKQYVDIARFINAIHTCKKACTCCCSFLEQSQAQDGVNKDVEGDITVTDSLIDDNDFYFKKRSKFIEVALTFEKNTKWKGYPKKESDLNDEKYRMHTNCKTLMQFNNTKGEVEYYEFARENLLYSKVVTNASDENSWLFKTLHQRPNKRINFTFTDPADREKEIITYRRMLNIISFNTECFLRLPMTIDILKKPIHSSDKDQTKRYRIEHARSFMGNNSKKSNIISIVSAIRNSKSPVRPITLPTPSTKRSSTSSQSAKRPTRTRRKLKQPTIMEQEAAQTINCLIKDILHRFRNVLLTINAEGKVSAALNAPLTSLTHSELKILSQILSHAQSQVDKLGLTPGTCLNPDAPMTIKSPDETSNSSTATANSNTEKSSMSSITAPNLGMSNGRTNQAFQEQGNYENCKSIILSKFSEITGYKKYQYKMSFRNYLGDGREAIPKITNVFSLNTRNCSSLDILENPLQGSNTVIEIDDGPSMNTEIGTDPRMSTKKRKRKTSTNISPKIKIKNTAEILIEKSASRNTPVVYPNLEIVTCDTLGPITSIPMATSDSNDVSDNNLLHNLDIDELKNFEVLPFPQHVPQTEAARFYEVHDDGTIIKNSNFPIP